MKYRVNIDKYYYITIVVVSLILLIPLILSIVAKRVWVILVVAFLIIFVEYLLFSCFIGYAKLEEDHLVIRYGFIIKRRLPYEIIRGVEKKSSYFSESLISLKTTKNCVVVLFNTYDNTTISIKDEDDFIEKLLEKLKEYPCKEE